MYKGINKTSNLKFSFNKNKGVLRARTGGILYGHCIIHSCFNRYLTYYNYILNNTLVKYYIDMRIQIILEIIMNIVFFSAYVYLLLQLYMILEVLTNCRAHPWNRNIYKTKNCLIKRVFPVETIAGWYLMLGLTRMVFCDLENFECVHLKNNSLPVMYLTLFFSICPV